MDKLKSFVWLDFVTVKPYFFGKNILVFVATALFMTVTSGSISSGIYVGMMLGTLFIGYSFAVGEKSDMDALYITLSVNRKTVVLGRYIFTLLLNVCVVAFVCSVALVGLPIARLVGIGGDGVGDALWTGVLLAALFAVVQAIQLPIFFKYNYAKAKVISIAPFVALMAAFVAFTTIAKGTETVNRVTGFIVNLNLSWLIVCAVLALVIIMLGSYKLSLSFYKKREF